MKRYQVVEARVWEHENGPPHRTRKEAQAFADRLYSFGPAVMDRSGK